MDLPVADDLRVVFFALWAAGRRDDFRLLGARFVLTGSAMGRSISQGAVTETTRSPSFSSWITLPRAVRPRLGRALGRLE
ncbi:MAG: hypothetical protein ACWGO1_03765, partial [Anaerolineales bacterium]